MFRSKWILQKIYPLYAQKMQPLLELVKKGVKWKQEEHPEVFDQVRELFSKNIIYTIHKKKDHL